MTERQDHMAGGSPVPAFGNILCAVDGKEGGFTAVEQAAAFAGHGGHLTLLVVTSFRSEGAYRAPAIGPSRATGILERAARIAQEAGVPYSTEVDPATPPAQVILDWSSQYDLLALGAPASSWFGSWFIEGVADMAMDVMTASMLVARPTAGVDRRFADRVLVASDCLDASDGLVDLAGRIAEAHQAHLTLLHAVGHERPNKDHRVEQQERRLEEQVHRLERTPAITSDTRVEPGNAHDVIVDTARTELASLVVIGSRRLDGLRAIGSVSRRVAHDADCSVLLVAPEKLQSAVPV
jgi:nucleotide-binding universal stress UspA family protein